MNTMLISAGEISDASDKPYMSALNVNSLITKKNSLMTADTKNLLFLSVKLPVTVMYKHYMWIYCMFCTPGRTNKTAESWLCLLHQIIFVTFMRTG